MTFGLVFLMASAVAFVIAAVIVELYIIFFY